MNSYENYSRSSLDYDQTRAAVGLEIITGCLLEAGLVLQQSRVLDAGCGTGNYVKALANKVSSVVGVDRNTGMLLQAQEKLAAETGAGRVELLQGELTNLPLPPSSIDAAVMNQVLHHLPDTRQQGWPLRHQVFTELARVIRPGGVFILNACTPTQLRNSWWFYQLIPEACKHMIERHLQAQEIRQLFSLAGFEYHTCWVPVDTLMQGTHYFDSHGPEQSAWRHGDSIWAELSETQLQQALVRLQQLHDGGGIDELMAESETRRQSYGQLSFFYGIRRGVQ